MFRNEKEEAAKEFNHTTLVTHRELRPGHVPLRAEQVGCTLVLTVGCRVHWACGLHGCGCCPSPLSWTSCLCFHCDELHACTELGQGICVGGRSFRGLLSNKGAGEPTQLLSKSLSSLLPPPHRVRLSSSGPRCQASERQERGQLQGVQSVLNVCLLCSVARAGLPSRVLPGVV